MWFLYGVTVAWVLSQFTTVIFNKFMFNVDDKKSLDPDERNGYDDEYTLLCYVISYENGEIESLGETTLDEIENKNEMNKIDYITIKYMFNGKLMKYITRHMDIEFPIYSFNIEPEKYIYYPDIMFLNNRDVTDYIRPYLGPLCNFYADREEPIKLQDALREHPDYDEFDFEEGTFIMISNKTKLYGRKIIQKELPCNYVVWKRHAAVDPRDDQKLL
tara:strand:- start:13138 stop:13788 length:651 start_codon:yes stop_codon:yes gene_type:complete